MIFWLLPYHAPVINRCCGPTRSISNEATAVPLSGARSRHGGGRSRNAVLEKTTKKLRKNYRRRMAGTSAVTGHPAFVALSSLASIVLHPD
ncbi:MAG TPA: hypothetical protein VFM11_13730 [Burkholderiales bacterium]|nr:hypothetical protein [Burkholderiales bacterium]